MWTGQLESRFTVENIPVVVKTYAHQELDAIAVQINSPLLAEKTHCYPFAFSLPQW